MAVIYCEECEKLSPDDTGACAHCGAALSKTRPKPIRAATRTTPTPLTTPPDVKAEPQSGPLGACAHCGGTISPEARSCPHCGAPGPAASDLSRYDKLIALVGAVLVAVGVFAPVVSAPIFGDVHLFGAEDGTGKIILVGALLSLLLFVAGWRQWANRVGHAVVFGVIATFAFMSIRLRAAKQEMLNVENDGDLFADFAKTMAEAMAAQIQMQWGWLPLFIGAALLIAPWWLSALKAQPVKLERQSIVLASVIAAACALGFLAA